MEMQLLEWFYQGGLAVWAVAFIAGVLSFLSPCILPLIPAYMSYISGISLQQLDARGARAMRVGIVAKACCFVLGFSVVFVGVGLALSSVISLLRSPLTNLIAGGIIVLFGAHFLGLWHASWLTKSARYTPSIPTQMLAPFILGVSFALGYTPCTGVIFGAITLLVGMSDYGVWLLIMYACGLAVPFLCIAVALDRGFAMLKRLKPFMRVIEICSGCVLIIVGVIIMLGGLTWLTTWLIR